MGRAAQGPSLLAGLLLDGQGDRLTPSHTVKQGKRYRYYISQALAVGRRADLARARRLPAGELEQLVTQKLQQFFADRGAVLAALGGHVEAADALAKHLEQASTLSASWPALTPADLRALLLSLVKRVTVHAKHVHIDVLPTSLPELLRVDPTDWPVSSAGNGDYPPPTIRLTVLATLKRAGIGTRMVVDGGDGTTGRKHPDPSLVKIVIKAHDFHGRLVKSGGSSLRDVAQAAGVTPSYSTRLLRLAYLAPDITHAIVQGRQPPTLTARTLTKASQLPLHWDAQRRLLGFD